MGIRVPNGLDQNILGALGFPILFPYYLEWSFADNLFDLSQFCGCHASDYKHYEGRVIIRSWLTHVHKQTGKIHRI